MADGSELDLGEQIRIRREAAGLTQGQLAQMADTNQQTVQRIETGVTVNSKAIPNILKVLTSNDLRQESSHNDVARSYMTALDEINFKKSAKRNSSYACDGHKETVFLRRNLKLYFSSELDPGIISTDYAKFIHLDILKKLHASENAFAMYVPVSDMEPELEPGDIILADENAPPIRNVTCIFQDNRNNSAICTIKRLVSSDADNWIVKSWSPSREFALPKTAWPICIRIIGKISRL